MKNSILIIFYAALFGLFNTEARVEENAFALKQSDQRNIFVPDQPVEKSIFISQPSSELMASELRQPAEEIQSMKFNTNGLYYAEFFDYIYRGHFENVEITRDDMEFLMIFDAYLRTFGRNCAEYLPIGAVDIMDLECAVEKYTVNGWGVETSRYCVEYRLEKSHLKARPELYDALSYVNKKQGANALGTAISMMTDPNAVGNSVDMIHKVNGLRSDLDQLFQLNPCNNTGVRRFEENLRLFALQQASLRMEGESKYASMKKSGGPTGPQDLTRLVDDLVTNQSKTWAFNRYITGSISDLAVEQQDTQGRPVVVRANYNYNGFGGRSSGWVQVTFNNGLPECIYFFDYPRNCKNANSSIVASYSQGEYAGN